MNEQYKTIELLTSENERLQRRIDRLELQKDYILKECRKAVLVGVEVLENLRRAVL